MDDRPPVLDGKTPDLAAWLAVHPEIATVLIATPDINGVLRAKG